MAGAESGELRLADPAVTVRLRRASGARRLTLRVSAQDGSVHLTLPRRTPLAEARAFLERQAPWLRERLAAAPQRVAVGPGCLLPVGGVAHEVVAGTGRAPRIEGGRLVVPGPAGRVGPRVAVFLKALARDRLAAAADFHAGRLARVPGRITLRDPVSRWGSCTAAGDLMFSWRLVMAPPEVLDYVAAHEVAHLVEMNHSDRFWAHVTRLCPDWPVRRDWLRAHGPGLHRYGFAGSEGVDFGGGPA